MSSSEASDTQDLQDPDGSTLTVRQKLIFTGILLVLAGGGALVVAELGLWAVGSPPDMPLRVAHVPGHRETVKHLAYTYDVAINDQGLRDEELPLSPPPGEKRVFVVGDSFVEGVGVNVADRWTDRVEALLSTPNEPVRLVNGGLRGTGALHHGRIFAKIGLQYRPKALLIAIFANDVDDTLPLSTPEQMLNAKPRRTGLSALIHAVFPRLKTRISMFVVQRRFARRTSQGDFLATMERAAEQRGIPPEAVQKWKAALKPDHVKAVDAGKLNGAILSLPLMKPDFWEAGVALSERGRRHLQALERLHADTIVRAKKAGVDVALVYMPSCVTTAPRCHSQNALEVSLGMRTDKAWLDGTPPIVTALTNFARKQQVPLLDLTPVFRRAEANITREHDGRPPKGVALDFFPYDMHWSPAGNALAARSIADFLRQSDVFPGLSLPLAASADSADSAASD